MERGLGQEAKWWKTKTKLESRIRVKDLRSWSFLVWRGKAEERLPMFSKSWRMRKSTCSSHCWALTGSRDRWQLEAVLRASCLGRGWETDLPCYPGRMQDHLAWTVFFFERQSQLKKPGGIESRTRVDALQKFVQWKTKTRALAFQDCWMTSLLGKGVSNSGWGNSLVINIDQAFIKNKYKELCRLWISSGVGPT